MFFVVLGEYHLGGNLTRREVFWERITRGVNPRRKGIPQADDHGKPRRPGGAAVPMTQSASALPWRQHARFGRVKTFIQKSAVKVS